MTIREVVKVLKNVEKISIAYNGGFVPFNKYDQLMLDAYGRYVVDEISALEEDSIEISVAMVPLKEGE